MSIECKCDVTALCSDMASDALKTTGVAKEQNTAKGNAHRVQSDQREASQSEETDCEEGSRKHPEGVKGPEPPHHARRPMNAFLIFCKRHRGVVRDRFPHLENRSVTKILGEWWANLEAQEKASYTELAKQYKEAFLQANPDFKWYKLPAPPLRTLVTRPSNQTRPLKLECDTACGGPITPGKLADETQMGSLSSLLASLPPPPGPAPLTPPPIPAATGPPKPPKKRYLQELGAGEVQHTLPMPPVYRLRMAASEETDRNTESRSPFRLLRPSPAAPQKGGVLSEGTTLKTSKQDIIDRVVDRMCRLSDGEAAGSKLSDNNNDAQYPCSRERSLVGDVDSRCCTGGQSQKSLLHSSGSPGPPVERNDAHEVAWDTDDGKVGAVVPSAFEDFVAREKEPSTVQEDSEDSANFPVAPGRKFSDEIKDFTLSDRDGELSTFSSSYEPGTASTTADCLNLKKTKASSKEFQKESCETVGDRITTPNTLIGEYAGSSTRESSVGEESDTSVEKTAYGMKTKVSKDLSSSLDTNRGSFSVPPRDMGAECLQQSTANEEQQRVPSSPGRSPTGFECPPEERFLLTDKFVRRDCVTQLSRSQDTSNSSVGTENGDNLGPIHAVGCIEKDRDSVALSTAAAECLPGAKTKWKRVCSFPKVKKLHHSESTEKVQSASDLLKCVDSPTVPIVSSEGQGRELTVSHGKEDCSRESTDDFSDSKLEEDISSDDVCRRPDVEEMMKVQAKKTVQKHVQVKPSVRTVESATQFDGGTRDHVFVSESLKKKRNKVKNVCSTALLKYRHVVHDTEGKDGGKTEGLATVICSTNDSGIFPPVRSVECKGESATNCTGEVKVKIANKIPPSNIQNQSPVKKPAKLRGVSKKREHICLSSGSEMVKIHPEKDFKRMKLDKKIVQDVQTKNVPEAESASKGFAEDSGLLLPYDVLEERDVGMCDRKRVTGSKMPAECLDLNVYSIVQNNNCQETRIYDSENFKGEVGTIHSASANKDNLCQEEKNLHKAPVHSVSSKSNSDVEDNGTIETCASRVPSVPEAARTFNELAETMRTEENSNNSDSVFRTDNVELVNICASKDNIFKDESDKMCDQSTLDSSSKLVRTSVPVESYQGSSISVVEESAIGELTASSSSVVLDIDLDLTQTRLSPQGLADLAAKDGVVVLTLPADDELVLPSLLPEPQLPVVAVQPAAVECLEAASQTHTEAELQDAGGSSIVGNGVLPTIDKDTSSIESEDSRESMSKETAAPSTKVTEVVSPDVSDSGLDSAAGKPREDLSVDGCSSRAAAQMPMPLEGAGECLPVMNACADSSVSIQKSEESCDGESSGARRKSTRTCKGLRYHQFMVEGRLKKGHRRPLSRGSSEKGVKALRSSSCALAPHSTGVLMPSVPVTSPSDGTCALPSVAFPPVSSSNSRSGSRDVSSGSDRSDAEMDMPLEMRNLFSTSDNLQRVYTTKSKIEKHLKDALEDSMLDSPAKKRFRAADFNLEEKIEALPSLSLEEFQMKKKARKRKAAPPLPPLDSRPPPKQTVPSPAVSPDSTEGNNAGNRVTLTVEATAVVTSSDGGRVCSTAQLQSAGAVGSTSAVGGAADVSRQLVGSQKRKARKQSITRLDSDNVHILRDTAVVEPAVLSNIALSSLAAIAVTGNKLVK